MSRARCNASSARLRRTGTVTNTGVWYGPGSAERHEECRTASGARDLRLLPHHRIKAPWTGTGGREIETCEAEQGCGGAATEKRMPYRRSRLEHMANEVCECHFPRQYECRDPAEQSDHQKSAENQLDRAGGAYQRHQLRFFEHCAGRKF